MFGVESLVVPLALQKMRESSRANVDEFLKNGGDDCLVENLKVEASLA